MTISVADVLRVCGVRDPEPDEFIAPLSRGLIDAWRAHIVAMGGLDEEPEFFFGMRIVETKPISGDLVFVKSGTLKRLAAGWYRGV